MQLVQVVFWEHKLVQLVVAWPMNQLGQLVKVLCQLLQLKMDKVLSQLKQLVLDEMVVEQQLVQLYMIE